MPRYGSDDYGLEDRINSTLSGSEYPHEGGTTDLRGAVSQIYRTALGREPDEPGLTSWTKGRTPADLSWIQQQIYASPEAQAYSQKRTAAAAPASGADYIRSIVNKWMTSNNPQGHRDAEYWVNAIMGEGGFNDKYNENYWLGRFTEPDRGGAVGGGVSYQQFDDPAASLIEKLALDRVNRLSKAPDRPNLDAYIKSLLDREQASRARAGEFANTLRSRAADLNKPAYSEGDEAVLRAKAFDQLERRRQQTLKNERENVYMRGFAPTSGLVAGQENAVNDRFEQARTGIESDLLQQMLQETQRRKDRAIQLESLAQQALEGGDLAGLQALAQVADFEDQMVQEADQRERERLAAAAIPNDLAMNRTQLGLQILGQGGSPMSLINSLLQMAELGQRGRQLDIAGRNSNLSGLGTLASLGLQGLDLWRNWGK